MLKKFQRKGKTACERPYLTQEKYKLKGTQNKIA